MAQARRPSPSAPLHAMTAGWYLPVARFLGRSSRFASDEADDLVKVARDVIVGVTRSPKAPTRDLRAGPSVPVLIRELSQVVSLGDCVSLQSDQSFWCLVRELYSRRPWVPRRPRDLVDTVGIEVKEQSASANTANDADATVRGPTAGLGGVEGKAT